MADREISATTTLGEDVLFTQMDGFDEVSQVFRYELGLISKNVDLMAEDILGKPATIKIGKEAGVRFFHGIVTDFGLHEFRDDYAHYRAILRPWLWFASTNTDNRIFQMMSVVDIIEAVFQSYPDAKFEKRLQKSYAPRDYTVQYGESDLDFVQRLMEHEGIFYHFNHAEDGHTLILTDANANLKTNDGFDVLDFEADGSVSFLDGDYITRWTPRSSVRPATSVQTDYDFEKPALDLMSKSDSPMGHDLDSGEHYHYPGNYITLKRGEALAEVRRQELQTPYTRIEAQSTVRGLWSGLKFKFDLFPRDSENGEYFVHRAEYELYDDQYRTGADRRGEGFFTRLTLTPTALPVRPDRRTPKPVMRGPQTAVVVGPAGEEIFTDKYSRVKVQFHWDREGKKDENSSCFVRVSSVWAGSGWGFIQIPRIGQEVIVDFLEGDPDQPIITGRVYNAAQMPPYGLPGTATQSGWKSNSSPGGGGWNEMRFEDKAGSEEVYFQAQKDHNELVKNNESRTIGNDFAEDVGHDAKQDIGHDRHETVGNDKTLKVGKNRTGQIGVNDTESVGSNRILKVGANETISVGANSTETIGANHSQTVALVQTVTVGGARADTVGGAEARTVGAAQAQTVGAARTVTVGSGQTHTIGADDGWSVGGGQSVTVAKDQTVSIGANQSYTIGGDETHKVAKGRATEITANDMLNAKADMGTKVAKKYVLDVGDEITLKCGDAQVTLKKDGTITIKGKDITIDGSGKINAKAGGDITMKGSKINQN